MRWTAIIVAAGKGERFGHAAQAKQFLEILGRPLIFYPLRVFLDVDIFTQVVVVVAQQQIEIVRNYLHEHFSMEEVEKFRVVQGGKRRGDSVYQGLLAAEGSDFVAIHDGARPCITRDLLHKLVKATETEGAVVPGTPLQDTIKRLRPRAGVICETVERTDLWAVQTPQCFRYEIIRCAYDEALQQRHVDTDDAALVERLGIPVKVIAGDPSNLKVTVSEDLPTVTRLLEEGYV